VITHPEKVLFPVDGITKGELARYYETVAPATLPHLRGRPVTMERFPAGIERKGFIQKDVAKLAPEWVERVDVPKKGGQSSHALVTDERALLWMINLNTITPHIWVSRVPDLHAPDLCVFDLDPSQEDDAALRAAALLVRAQLEELGLESAIKTSGSKGFHIAVALDRASDFETLWPFSHAVGSLLVKRHPSVFTQEFIKADRGGRILIDTGRNGFGATFAAPYAVRPRNGAPVSAPCTWDEIEQGKVGPRTFTLRNVPERLAEVGDVWSTLAARPLSLTRSIEMLATLLTDEDLAQSRAASVRRPKGRNAPRERSSEAHRK
jgi:bifunctional non-homologous end joining protein LigD